MSRLKTSEDQIQFVIIATGMLADHGTYFQANDRAAMQRE
jgi:hypothetical protein